MSWRRVTIIGGAIVVALAAGCDDGQELLLRALSSEAGSLKSFCEQNNFKAPEISRGDSLVALASVNQGRGMTADAFGNLDLAVIYYRLALSRLNLERTEAAVEAARKKLADDEEQCRTYAEVLGELRGGSR